MDQESLIPRSKPRFEIKEIYSGGNESVGIYSLRGCADKFEDISMDRRGFFKLSLFLPIVMALGVTVPASCTSSEKLPFSASGIISSVELKDLEASIICVEIDEASMKGGDTNVPIGLKVDDIVNVAVDQAKDPLDVLGRITRIDLPGKIICIEVSLDKQAYSRKQYRSSLLGAGTHFNSTDMKITDIKELHLKNGAVIHSGPIKIMGKGERICFSRGGATISVPATNVNILKSLTETFRKESTDEPYIPKPMSAHRGRKVETCRCVPVASRSGVRLCACVPVYPKSAHSGRRVDSCRCVPVGEPVD